MTNRITQIDRDIVKDAGMTPRSFERAEKRLKANWNERSRKEAIRKSKFNKVSRLRQVDYVRVEPTAARIAAARIETLIIGGNFEQAAIVLDQIRRETEIELAAKANRKLTPYEAAQELCRKRAMHVEELGIKLRTSDILNSHGFAIVGELLDCFPLGLIYLYQIGPAAVDEIAAAFVKLGLLTAGQARERVEQYESAMRVRK